MIPKHKTLYVLAATVLLCSTIACAARNDANFVEIQRSQRHATTLWLNVGSFKRITSNVQRITLPVVALVDESDGAKWQLGLSYPQRELVLRLQTRNETVATSTSITRLHSNRWYRVAMHTVVDQRKLAFHVFLDGKAVVSKRHFGMSASIDVAPSRLALFDEQLEYAALDINVQVTEPEVLPHWLDLLELQSLKCNTGDDLDRPVKVHSSLPLTVAKEMPLRRLLDSSGEIACQQRLTEGEGAKSLESAQRSALIVMWCEAYNVRDEQLWQEECGPSRLQRRVFSLAQSLPASATLRLPLRRKQYQEWKDGLDRATRPLRSHVQLLEIGTGDNYAAAMNMAVQGSQQDAIVFSSLHLVHQPGWLDALLAPLFLDDKNNNNGDENSHPPYAAVGGIVLRPDHTILHAGLELMEVALPAEMVILPHLRLRGYWLSDDRLNDSAATLHGLHRALLAVRRRDFERVGGYDVRFSPGLEDMDLSLKLTQQLLPGATLHLTPEAVAVSDVSLTFIPLHETAHMSELLLHPTASVGAGGGGAVLAFWQKWHDELTAIRQQQFVTDATFTWVMHCGGSQGIEAATILQELHRLVNTRAIVRGYRECEHSDTISGMPQYFQDVLEATVTKTFGGSLPGNATSAANGEIVLYARDYREIGRWVPYDAGYVIGRYMFEADALPKPWAKQCNQLDEVWVPSTWQQDAFARSGVQADKIFVQKEAVDHHLYDPDRVEPLALPGTRLDGEEPRPFTFLSVFKFEDRKGWMTLVSSYVREFAGVQDVNLVLRTYLHRAGDSGDIYDKDEIYRRIYEHLLRQPDMPDQDTWPSIDVVSEHIHSQNLPGLYKACDAFVLPTHGEGWGLPTHEAMLMGLPVITTNWGGSTEFLSRQWAYPIQITGLAPTSTSDPWLRGFKWANPNGMHLQQLMRHVYTFRDAARQKGQLGRQYALEHLTPLVIAREYARRIAEISAAGASSAAATEQGRGRGLNVMKVFDRKWGMSAQFKSCAVTSKVEAQMISRTKGSSSDTSRTIQDACDMIVLTTYPPRECGIATFAESLIHGIRAVCPPGSRIEVMISAHDKDEVLRYDPTLVKSSIYEFHQYEYASAAEYINQRGFKTVLLQFEYGIFPGAGIICLLQDLNARVITTLHTVGRTMFEEYHALVQQFALTSYKLVTMTHTMKRTLVASHAISAQDIQVIPHGVPDIPFERLQGTPRQVAFAGKKLILSNGLLHPYKGIEYVIEAMVEVHAQHPDAVYLIQGKPHPTGINTHEYYRQLIAQVEQLGLQDVVVFNETFIPNDELYRLLQSTHVYVNAYTDSSQSVSGTLAMAVGTGTACISTPYPYAQELLANGVGVLVPYRDSAAIAEAIVRLLDGEDSGATSEIAAMNERAIAAARSMRWSDVAREYVRVAME